MFNQSLHAGDYLSATLVWDRQVVLQANSAPFDQYKPGDEFIDNRFNNLDLYVVPAGYVLPPDETVPPNPVAASVSTVLNVEHIFAPITVDGSYEIWVYLKDQFPTAGADYALAWWAGGNPSHASMGDFNGDGIVDAADYGVWKGAFGSNNASADGNGDGVVNAADYVIWRDHLSQSVGSGAASVPEPNTAVLLSVVVALALPVRRRSASLL